MTDPTEGTDLPDVDEYEVDESASDSAARESAAAEERRAEQRAELGALRRARVSQAAPWVGIAACVIVAALCFAFAVGGSGPATGPSAGQEGLLGVTGAFPSNDSSAGAPAGIAVSGDRVYVADSIRGVIDVLTREGSRVATIGAGWLQTPAYVAVGPVDGRVYVTDRARGQVGVFSSTGRFEGVLAPDGLRTNAKTGPVWRPLALTFAPDGTLYVADSGSSQSIAVFAPDGSRTGTLGADVPPGRTGHALAFVNGIAATADRVLVADSNNGRLLAFDRSGRFTGEIPLDGLPRGLVVTSSGRVVLTDAASYGVALLDPSGAPLQTITGGVGDREQFAAPAGLAIDPAGTVYVADAVTRRVFTLRFGAGSNGAAALSGSARQFLYVLGALALLAAFALVALIRNRARARVRESDHTL